MKKLICYLFDQSRRDNVFVQSGDPNIGPGLNEWLQGTKRYLIAFRDKDRRAVEMGEHFELYNQLRSMLPSKRSIEWKLYVDEGTRKIFVDTWEGDDSEIEDDGFTA